MNPYMTFTCCWFEFWHCLCNIYKTCPDNENDRERNLCRRGRSHLTRLTSSFSSGVASGLTDSKTRSARQQRLSTPQFWPVIGKRNAIPVWGKHHFVFTFFRSLLSSIPGHDSASSTPLSSSIHLHSSHISAFIHISLYRFFQPVTLNIHLSLSAFCNISDFLFLLFQLRLRRLL